MTTTTQQQTTADAAQIIENKVNQETDKLRSRLAVLIREADPKEQRQLRLKIRDLRQCIQLMKDGGAMIAAALFDADAA